MKKTLWTALFAIILVWLFVCCGKPAATVETPLPFAEPTATAETDLVADSVTPDPTADLPTPPPPTETPEPETPAPTEEPVAVSLGETEGDFVSRTGCLAELPVDANDVIYSATDNTVAYSAGSETFTLTAEQQVPIEIIHSSDTVKEGYPELTVDYQNLKAILQWTPVSWADGYEIFRKLDKTGTYKSIATLSNKKTEYDDVYYDSMLNKAEIDLLTATNFIDPSVNKLVYAVRAYKTSKSKKLYSDYMEYFTLAEPAIASVETGTQTALIQWATVPLADGYQIYVGAEAPDGTLRWKRVGCCEQVKTDRTELLVPWSDEYPFFTVEAYAYRNGQKIFSGHDEGFRVDLRRYGNKTILFMGDSITFGSPYKKAVRSPLNGTVDFFSYATRVAQLTGVQFYNPSIPGSTYAMKDKHNRDHIITQVANRLVYGGDMVVETEEQQGAYHQNREHRRYEDFDVIVLAAGTNDYLDNTPLGEPDSTDIYTFYGALNTIFGYLENANVKRAALGKQPIKVIRADLFYSDRTYHYENRTNRFITKNRIDLTLTDYQKCLYTLADHYRSRGMDIYRWETIGYIDEKTCPYRATDNLHMTKFTSGQIGNGLAAFMIEKGILD